MNIAIAAANTPRAPKRSTIQPLTGMNTATVSIYAVTPMFKPTGSVPKDHAICGSAVTMTVLPRFSMKNAAATRAVICVARRPIGRFASQSQRSQGLRQAALRSFGHVHLRLPVPIRRSADRPTTNAVSFTGRCQLAIIELRMKFIGSRVLCPQLS